MKIGIATFQWADNYGAVIQSHALQAYLKEQGNEVAIINFQPQTFNSGLRQFIATTPKATLAKWEAFYKRKIFQHFRDRYLQLTPNVFHTAADLESIKDRFDLLIAGSDQVWNPKWLSQFQGLWDLYFLRFAGNKTRRISYAASFGHADTKTISVEDQIRIGSYLIEFDAISVREKSGVDIVNKLSGRDDSMKVSDPTLLHDRSFYEKLAGTSRKRTPYLFNYMLHGQLRNAHQLEYEISRPLKLKVLKCNVLNSRLHKGYTMPSPCGWLRMIRDANFVITNSFHGVVFCLIFNTPFLVLLSEGELGSMNNRITDLLADVRLSERVIGISKPDKINSLLTDIDWQPANNELIKLHELAANFITSNV